MAKGAQHYTRKGKTDKGRTSINKEGEEEPSLARRSKRCWDLWKFASTLSKYEIEYLVTLRRNRIKYEDNQLEIKELRTEIKLLEDIRKIVARRMKEERD